MLKFKPLVALFLAFALLFSLAPASSGTDDYTEDEFPSVVETEEPVGGGFEEGGSIEEGFVGEQQPLERFYIEDMTEEEIEAVLQRIANGENVIFGDGIPFDFEQSSGSRWSGNVNSTHQWLTGRAFELIADESPFTPAVYSNYLCLSQANIATIVEYSDWPDTNEVSPVILGVNTNSWHFYHGNSGANYGTNYWRNYYDRHNAGSRLIFWYDSAVTKYNNGDRTGAFQDLGKALHYLQDLNAPPHTGDSFAWYEAPGAATFAYLNHTPYEVAANNERAQHAVTSGGLYSFHRTNDLQTIIDTAAYNSYLYYNQAYSSDRGDSIRAPLRRSQRDSAGLIYRFFNEVICYGDLDGNGRINSNDVTWMRRTLAGWLDYQRGLPQCTVSGWGYRPDAYDITYLRRRVASWPGYEKLGPVH